MKIVSFDVGVKNLAYCILEYTHPGIYTIIDWNIIDLSESDIPSLCNSELKNKKICNKKCTYIEKIADLNIAVCKKHITVIKNAIPIKKILVSKIPLQRLNTTLITLLDNLPQLLGVDQVLIENQPVLKNPRMKTIQIMLYSYFITRGIIDKPGNNSLITNIQLIAARNKLTAYDGPEVVCNIKSKYGRTKRLSVEYCKYMIKDDVVFSELFANSNKKDDLADCYLQGVYYFKKTTI